MVFLICWFYSIFILNVFCARYMWLWISFCFCCVVSGVFIKQIWLGNRYCATLVFEKVPSAAFIWKEYWNAWREKFFMHRTFIFLHLYVHMHRCVCFLAWACFFFIGCSVLSVLLSGLFSLWWYVYLEFQKSVSDQFFWLVFLCEGAFWEQFRLFFIIFWMLYDVYVFDVKEYGICVVRCGMIWQGAKEAGIYC